MSMITPYILTDYDVRMFLQEAPRGGRVRRALPFATATVAAGLLLFLTLALIGPGQSPVSATSTVPVVLPASLLQTPVPDATPVPTPTPAPTPVASPLAVTLPNDTLALSTLKVSAPVLWDIAYNDKAMTEALRNGVIHLAGTPKPGEQGMAAIAGHSSNYPWVRGGFNHIFAPLTKAKVGQTIELNYNGTMYRYTISKVYEVKPSEVQLLNDHSRTGLRLITCTPVGTSLRRLIVEADQVFPEPATARAFAGQALAAALPGR